MSVASSTISLSDDDNEQKLRPPSLERVSNGNDTFECPFCCSIQIFRNENLWQRHVYADLRSYVCTFADCNSKLFEDQRQWFEHEVEHHRSKWHCSICNIQGITAKVDFRNHIRSHADGVTENQLDALCKAFRQPQKRFLASECPFCTAWNEKLRNSKENHDAPSVTSTQFMKHVASHMRQLALFALPREFTEEAEDTATRSVRSIDEADVGAISITHNESPAESPRSISPNEPNDRHDHSGCLVEKLEGKGGKADYFWYCCKCGDGPWNFGHINHCISCNEHIRCTGGPPHDASSSNRNERDTEDKMSVSEAEGKDSTPEPSLTQQLPNPDNKFTGTDYAWYCCGCGDGPWNVSHWVACGLCDHMKCAGCTVEC
jgi:hypothetical protein